MAFRIQTKPNPTHDNLKHQTYWGWEGLDRIIYVRIISISNYSNKPVWFFFYIYKKVAIADRSGSIIYS
jgi:hypothetical protein